MSFFTQVYELVKQIPIGKVTTYGEIARALGRPHASKAVGYALHSNPDHDNIPCHRVVNRFGEASEAFAFGGENVQIGLLETEGVEFVCGKVDMEKYFYSFD